MSQDTVISICVSAMEVAMKIALPLLLVGLIVGLLVSIFQAVTQIQEQTLSFIPKIAGMAVVLVVAGPWMLSQILGWTEELYSQIPALVGG
jgi:flagellar biosynthesis protein FliQ